MADSSPFHLHAPARVGGTLSGELRLPQDAVLLHRAERVTFRVRGQLTYDDEGTQRSELPEGRDFVHVEPLRGRAVLPFRLKLPEDAPPSYQGKKDVHITWEVIASLQDGHGTDLMTWLQPFPLEPGRTTQPPKWLEPAVPRPVNPHLVWLWLLLPALFCFCPGLMGVLTDKRQHSGGERLTGVLCGLALLVAGVLITWGLFLKARTTSKFKVASLLPLAEAFPLGSTARLRVFLETTETLPVRGASLKLTSYEGVSPVRSTDAVPVSLPASLPAGLHRFDVEIPIPRDFPPTLGVHLGTLSHLRLELGGDLGVQELNGKLTLTPRVLEDAGEGAR